MDKRFLPIRAKIIAAYGCDIAEAKCYFSSRNYVFVFTDGKTVIRVSLGRKPGDRTALLSEVLWVDGLKQYSDTICAPVPSKHNNHFEEFQADGVFYRVTCFTQARGEMLDVSKADNWFYMLLGDMVGRIHQASRELWQQGIHFKRKNWYELPHFDPDTVKDKLEPALLDKCRTVMDKVKQIPANPNIYGMVHGDIGTNNYYVDINNIWVFDFDDCHYNFFMYDVASALSMWLMMGVSGSEKNRDFLFGSGMLDSFRQGYERHVTFPAAHWDDLELFVQLRYVFINIIMAKLTELGMDFDLDASRKMMAAILMADDVFAGLDRVGEAMRQAMAAAFGQGAATGADASAAGQVSADGKAIITLPAKVNTETAPALEEKILAIIAQGCRDLTLDCGELAYVSSAGLRVFLRAHKKLQGKFRLIHVPGMVHEVLETTGLNTLIKEE